MALTRPGGYIQAAAPVVTFLNGKGYWTQNQISQYKSTRKWPQQFSIVLAIPQQSLLPLLYAWDGSALAYSTYTAPGTNAYRGIAWDRAGRALFYANSGSTINGYEFTKAGGAVSTYTGGTFTYVPQTSTMKASPVADRLWYWAGADGSLCSIPYDPATKTFGTATRAVYLNAYPFSGDKRPSISPDGNFYGSGLSASGGIVYLYRINNSDGTSLGAISTPSTINSLGGNTHSVAWPPSGAAIGIGMGSGSPRFRIFRWSADTYYGAEYSYTAATGVGTNIVWKVFWNNAGNVVFFLTGAAAPDNIQAYQWDDTNGIGARFASPPSFTWSAGTTADVQLSPDDKLLVFNSASAGGSEIALAWDNTTGFGAVTSMPVGSANANSVAFGTLTV